MGVVIVVGVRNEESGEQAGHRNSLTKSWLPNQVLKMQVTCILALSKPRNLVQ